MFAGQLRFTRKFDQQRHERSIHTGEKPFKCPYVLLYTSGSLKGSALNDAMCPAFNETGDVTPNLLGRTLSLDTSVLMAPVSHLSRPRCR